MQQLVRLSTIYKRLGVSRRVAYYWASSGKLPGVVNLNGVWLINEQSLEKWIEENTIKEQEPRTAATHGKTAHTTKRISKPAISYVEYQPISPEARSLLRMLNERQKKSEGGGER